ncbi:MAG TPA: DUF6456 domain-containing protein [Microvirga sp.]|nr:DUF6456 domain-containing protein [Microvirga sp.]
MAGKTGRTKGGRRWREGEDPGARSGGRTDEEAGAGAAAAGRAGRLLAALAEEGAYALADPTEPGMLVVRKVRHGVSVGAGRFAEVDGEHLVRHDLAAWEGRRAGERRLRMTAPGAAHLRRAGAAEPFREQHGETGTAIVATEAGPERLRVDLDESPLDWLRRRRDRDGQPLIDEAAYQAGERLRADITAAGLLPSVTSRWDPVRGDGGPRGPADASDRVVAARQRVRHAFAAVGADFSDLLIDLCGFLKGLEVIERERRWPPRSAKVVVRIALARLAEHYGLESVAAGPAGARRIRAWQAAAFDRRADAAGPNLS